MTSSAEYHLRDLMTCPGPFDIQMHELIISVRQSLISVDIWHLLDLVQGMRMCSAKRPRTGPSCLCLSVGGCTQRSNTEILPRYAILNASHLLFISTKIQIKIRNRIFFWSRVRVFVRSRIFVRTRILILQLSVLCT